MDKKINARKKAQRLARQRKMRNRRIALTICLMIAVSLVSIGGTIAWLQDSTQEVKNTFTVGNIDIELKETGTTTTNGVDNKSYKMVPGKTESKDPTVTVKANSEKSYLFVEVTKDGGEVNVGNATYDFDDFLTYMITDGWTALNNQTKANGSGVFYRVVDATTDDVSYPIIGVESSDDGAVVAETTGNTELNTIEVKDTVTKEMMNEVTKNPSEQPTLSFKAYAIQFSELTKADGTEVNDAAGAWALINA